MCTVQITILYTNILTVIRFALYLFMSEMTLKKYANENECNFLQWDAKETKDLSQVFLHPC